MRLNLYLRLVLPVIFLSSMITSSASAQGNTFWSAQKSIPEYLESTEEPPFLISDMNHTVHAFNSQPLQLNDSTSSTAIFYRQWTLEGGWTSPNDILFDPLGSIDLMGVTKDDEGTVHLIFQKNFGDIYYTQAFLPNSKTAAGWISPVRIASQSSHVRQGLPYFATIASDKTGDNLVVIYGGVQDGSGLYFTTSSDNGENWSNPYPLFFTADETLLVTNPKLYYGETGVFHAMWAVTRSSGFGENGYYANFDPVSNEWSESVVLDVSGVQFPSIIEYKGDVFVGYYHENVNGNWWRRSSDGGETWTYPNQFSSNLVGTNGAVSFVIDGNNVLHAFFGERVDGNNHGIWHFVWNGTTWSSPEAVVRGPQIRDVSGGGGFDPRSAKAVVINGNLVLVTWGTDGFAGTNGAWFSYKHLDAPELPTVVLQSPTLVPQTTPTLEVVSTATTETASAGSGFAIDDDASAVPNPQTPLLVGVIPAILLVMGVIAVFYAVRSKGK